MNRVEPRGGRGLLCCASLWELSGAPSIIWVGRGPTRRATEPRKGGPDAASIISTANQLRYLSLGKAGCVVS